jgi:hypothetical protein
MCNSGIELFRLFQDKVVRRYLRRIYDGLAATHTADEAAEIAERRLAQGFRFLNYGLDHFVLLGGFGAIRDQARRWAPS